MSILFYRRPDYVQRHEGPLNVSECQLYAEKLRHRKDAIPPELSFENVIDNKALPPCTLNDFMDYLVYVAHDAENLQFYLWLQDYTARFDALKKEDKNLAPEWKWSATLAAGISETNTNPRGSTNSRTEKQAPTPLVIETRPPVDRSSRPRTSSSGALPNSLTSPTKTVFDDNTSIAPPPSDYESFMTRSAMTGRTIDEAVQDANTAVGLKWQPFTIQPFRQEIQKIITHYISPGGPRELNLSQQERTNVLHALQHTTHPSAFTPLLTMVDGMLRGQAHPNFVRWSICNGNKPRVFFVRTMGVSHIALGLLVGLLFTLSRVSRWYRILSAPVFFVGVSTMVAAYSGLCVILHHSHGRNLKPWEQTDNLTINSEGTNDSHVMNNMIRTSITSPTHKSWSKINDEEATLAGKEDNLKDVRMRPISFDTYGPRNSYIGEPWATEYEKKPMLKKIFDDSVWVQEGAIRVVQDKIVMKSNVWGLILTVLVTIMWVALPKGNFY